MNGRLQEPILVTMMIEVERPEFKQPSAWAKDVQYR